MAKGGKRYPLVIYTVLMDRWRPAIFTLGLAMFGVAFGIYRLGVEQWRWLATGSVGGFLVFVALVMTLLRKGAYIQPFRDHFKLATPFLKLNISYKRIRRTSSANMGKLFPRNSVPKSQIPVIEQIAKMTAIVIELTSFPMPQSQLKLFLSPLFFKDKTPHFVIIVDEKVWMQFSSELESMRTGEQVGGTVEPHVEPQKKQKKQDSSILSRLPRNK